MSDDNFEAAKRRKQMREETRKEAESILTLAGINQSTAWELANGYWSDAPDYDYVRRPWWLFQTPRGLIRIGWRKRVLEIDWSATEIRRIVTTDEVTNSPMMAHAYTTEKAVEYLRALVKP